MDKHPRTAGNPVTEFMVIFVLAVQQVVNHLVLTVGSGVVWAISWAVKIFVIVLYGHYLFGAGGSLIALFVESGTQWWWFFWEFLEMGVKFVLLNLFLIGVGVALGMAKERRNAG